MNINHNIAAAGATPFKINRIPILNLNEKLSNEVLNRSITAGQLGMHSNVPPVDDVGRERL